MGSGGNGISLDLGIGSSIDPLHLTEVTITAINSMQRKKVAVLFNTGTAGFGGSACGQRDVLLCSRPLVVGGESVKIR